MTLTSAILSLILLLPSTTNFAAASVVIQYDFFNEAACPEVGYTSIADSNECSQLALANGELTSTDANNEFGTPGCVWGLDPFAPAHPTRSLQEVNTDNFVFYWNDVENESASVNISPVCKGKLLRT